MKKNSGVLDFNVENLKSILPKRPSKWDYKQVKSFLKNFVKIERVADVFDEQEVDGKLFLSLNLNDKIFDTLNLKRNDEKILMEWQKLLLDYERENYKKISEEAATKRSNSPPLEKNISKKNKKQSSEEENPPLEKNISKKNKKKSSEEEEEKIEKSKKLKKKIDNEKSKEHGFEDSSKKKTEKTIDKFDSRDDEKSKNSTNHKEKKKNEKRKDDDFESSSKNKPEKTVDIYEGSAKNKHDKTVDLFESRAKKIVESSPNNQKPKKEKSFETLETKAKIKTKEEEESKTQNISSQNSSNYDDYNGKKTDKKKKKNPKNEKKYQPENNVNSLSDDEEGKSQTILRGSEPIKKAKNEEKKFSERNSNKLSKVEESDSMKNNLKKNAKEKKEDFDQDHDGKTQPKAMETVENKKFEIAINVINENAQHETYHFLKSFQICRSDPSIDTKERINLVDSQISKNHAQVIFLKKLGYYLQDLGSTNHTFIKLPKNSRIKLREGFELLIGDSLFKILSLTKTQIRLETNKLRCMDKTILEIKMTKDKLFFGKAPTPEDPKNHDVYQFIEDSEIEQTHVVFHKEQEKVLLEPKLSKNGVWLKIGERKKSSDFYLLKKFSEFKVGEVPLKVEKTWSEKASLCKGCGQQIRNTVFLPCNHAKLCEICASEKNKCVGKGRKTVSKEGKIKIPCDSREYKKFIDLSELE